mgnify:FL=1
MRKLKVFISILSLIILTTACDGNSRPQSNLTPNASTEAGHQNTTLTYTNLGDKTVQSEVRDILISGGVSGKNIDKVFVWINDFNECMGSCESYSIENSWKTAAIPVVDYGEYAPKSELWYKQNNRQYGDVLCRIAAYQLIQDNVDIQQPIDKKDWECYSETQWLYSDWDAISNFSLIDFDEKEISEYFTLFNPVTISAGCSQDEMYQAIQSAWKSRKISFAQNKASLITIWIQSESQTAAAHAAVLIQEEQGYLLFEKTNPQSPYQATKFSTIEQVKQYMYESIHIEDARYGYETGDYIVMQNDNLL